MIYLEVLLRNRGVRLNKGLKRAFGKASQSEYDKLKKIFVQMGWKQDQRPDVYFNPELFRAKEGNGSSDKFRLTS